MGNKITTNQSEKTNLLQDKEVGSKNRTYDCLPEFQVDPDTEYNCSPLTKSKGFTPLMRMVQRADRTDILEIITAYIKKYPHDLDHQNEMGWTALMIACRNSRTKSSDAIVNLLLKTDAKVDLQGKDGSTALMMACLNSCTTSSNAIVELLIKAGANVNLQNNQGWTALMLACLNSCTTSSNATVKLLLKAGANVDLQETDGWTALMMACRYSGTDSTNETVELLLKAGADMDLVNQNCKTALDMLNENSSKIIKKYIRERNKLKQKCLNLEKINQQLQSDLEFYKTSFDLHPDGTYIIGLKDHFHQTS